MPDPLGLFSPQPIPTTPPPAAPGLLGAQGGPQQPLPAGVPPIGAPPAKTGGSFIDRLLGGTPQATAGLLSPQDLKTARARSLLNIGASLLAASGPSGGQPATSTGAALGQALLSGQQAFQQNTQQAVTAQTQAMQMAKSKAIEALRQQWAAQPPPPANETQDARNQRLANMAAQATAVGDTDTAKAIADTIHSLWPPRGYGLDWRQMPGVVDKTTGEPVFYDSMTMATQTAGGKPVSGIVKEPLDPASMALQANAQAQHIAEFQARSQEAAARLAQAQQGMAATAQGRSDHLDELAAGGFQTRNAQLLQRETMFSGLQTAIAAAYKNPVAASGLVPQIAGYLDPRAQLRQGLWDRIQVLDKSIQGRIDMKTHTWAQGVPPTQQLDELKRYAYEVRGANRQLYERDYNMVTKQRPGAANLGRMMTPDEAYPDYALPPAIAANAGASPADTAAANAYIRSLHSTP